ncbi:DUF485 domain-containing protein [Heliophilum fasciatum]|uniref:Uncharacterized membrane protein (DUF485 family) n=1 Tax=Heliophilum fasciatum TaxID=35700 RepID=A0A4R2RIE4_9FIRM|nr:DUF485 domain-containing protein [Heliophilum fasciatum]MCW2278797.1 uncharacterized membrane protein (DUF485 family) [Heliophilum fasciatum]TCP62468.1 uncharacterized membrane protein (DUF485 family) [Heliophilum fasciatum]
MSETKAVPVGDARWAHPTKAQGPNEMESQWKEISESPEFKGLMSAKAKFLIPAILFSFAYYFMLPISVGYFPQIMNKKIIGPINLAYLFALSQFFVAWAVAFVYAHVAGNHFDVTVDAIKAKYRGRSAR